MTSQQEADELLDLWRRKARQGIPPAERLLPAEIARAANNTGRAAPARPQQ